MADNVWYINEKGHLYNTEFPDNSERFIVEPYPKQMWFYDDGLTTTIIDTLPMSENTLTEPFPSEYWRIDKYHNNGHLWHDLLLEIPYSPPPPDPPEEPVYVPQIDWTSAMTQTYEYYVVDPETWLDVRPLNNIKTSNITRDSSVDTLGSASISTTELIDECYVRIYLKAFQNGYEHSEPLGTFLIMTPSLSFNGKVHTASISAYSPLIELKENNPPIGYYTKKDSGIITAVHDLLVQHMRAPISDSLDIYKYMETLSDNFEDVKLDKNFIANHEDDWFTYINDLLSKTSYKFDIDAFGKISLTKKQEINVMQPKWEYTDDENSILYSDISIDRDFYMIPNVVEVINTKSTGGRSIIVENNDENSPVSIVRRGRRIVKRVYNPSGLQGDTDEDIERYATKLLKQLSTLEVKLSYTHGYCPVKVGDCVLINYKKAGLVDVRAVVMSQSISCTPGCAVNETAVYIEKLWG